MNLWLRTRHAGTAMPEPKPSIISASASAQSWLFGSRRGFATLLILAALRVSAPGQSTVTLAWDPSPGTGVAGYRIYQGGSSRTYTNLMQVGNVTSATISGLMAGASYFFPIKAWGRNGLDSDFSNEISYTVAQPSPPTIELTSPADGAVYTAPATISLAASVGANGQTIAQVQFYNGANLLGARTAAPYTFAWTNVGAGTYLVKARAVLGSGSTLDSPNASVTVVAAQSGVGLTFAADSGTVTAPFVASNGTLSQPTTTGLAGGGRAVYSFNLPAGGSYLISALVIAPSLARNSLYVNVDAEPTDPLMIWDIPVCTSWTSRTVSWRGNDDPALPTVFALSAGKHELIIRGREEDTVLGAITIAAAPPRLQIAKGLGGLPLLTGVGQPGQTYRVLCSENLKVWTTLATVTADGNGSFQVSDPAASNRPSRMYRLLGVAVTPPKLQIRAKTSGSVILTATGQPSQTYSVQSSSNLKTWTTIGSMTLDATGSCQFTNLAGTSRTNCLYRLQAQ
jgi:hypothetical protein